MSFYTEQPPPQRPPYPLQDPIFVPSQSFPAAYPSPPPAPQHHATNPQPYAAAPPPAEHHSYPPPPSQQTYYPPTPPSSSTTTWDPSKIYAEANGLSPHQHDTRDQPTSAGAPGPNGERGIGAAVLGGGAGAFLGHEMGHGKMATLGGLAVGAIAAEALEHHHKNKKREHERERVFEEGYASGEERGSRSRSLSGSRSRGLDGERGFDDYDDDYDYDEREEPYRHHHHHHGGHHHGDGGYRDERVYDDDYYDGYEDRETERRDSYYRDDRY